MSQRSAANFRIFQRRADVVVGSPKRFCDGRFLHSFDFCSHFGASFASYETFYDFRDHFATAFLSSRNDRQRENVMIKRVVVERDGKARVREHFQTLSGDADVSAVTFSHQAHVIEKTEDLGRWLMNGANDCVAETRETLQ